MDMGIEDIYEREFELIEEPSISIYLPSDRIDYDGLFSCTICEDVCVCSGLLIEELAEDDIVLHKNLVKITRTK
jgi:hypothetical protein